MPPALLGEKEAPKCPEDPMALAPAPAMAGGDGSPLGPIRSNYSAGDSWR